MPATHLSYQNTKTHITHNIKKTKARPRREKGERVDQPKVGKRFLPPPLLPTSHPPDPRKSREGRAINKRGVGGIPFLNLGTREQGQELGRRKRTEGPPDPLQITQGQDLQWILTPESKCNGPGGPITRTKRRRPETIPSTGPEQAKLKQLSIQNHQKLKPSHQQTEIALPLNRGIGSVVSLRPLLREQRFSKKGTRQPCGASNAPKGEAL